MVAAAAKRSGGQTGAFEISASEAVCIVAATSAAPVAWLPSKDCSFPNFTGGLVPFGKSPRIRDWACVS